MITQTEIILNKIPPAKGRNEPAVKIHGYLMKILPDEVVQSYHDIKTTRPYSMHLLRENPNYDKLKINTLTSEAEIIIERLKSYKSIYFEDLNRDIEITSIKTVKQLTYEDLFCYPVKKQYKISILTPATYKKENCYSNWFHLGRLLNSSVLKLNYYGNCFIEKEYFREIDNNINIIDYKLSSAQYQIMNKKIDSLKGNITFKLRNNIEQPHLGAVLEYINYTGLGAKTAMGMGGVVSVGLV